MKMKLQIYPANPKVAYDGQNMVAVETNHPGATAHVVRAVNHHKALVEIVRLLTADVMGDDDVNQMVNFETAVEHARAILAELDGDATPNTPEGS